MGNSQNIDQGMKYNIEQEFNKIKNDKDYLTIKEVLQLQPLEDYPLKFDHIGNLWVLDSDKQGKITLKALFKFAQFCQNTLKHVQTYEFESQLQAATTMILFQTLKNENGEEVISEWIGKLLMENRDITMLPSYKNIPFIRMESVMILYEICHVKMLNGMEIQGFFDLLQQCGEEIGLMTLENEEFDEYVPLPVAKEFVKEFLKGFKKLMNEIGLDK